MAQNNDAEKKMLLVRPGGRKPSHAAAYVDSPRWTRSDVADFRASAARPRTPRGPVTNSRPKKPARREERADGRARRSQAFRRSEP